MKPNLTAAGLAALLWLAPAQVLAESHEGQVQQIRIDSDADAPVCAATSPGMPGGAWACIYPNRRHYQEMKEMLFRALEARHWCALEWTLKDTVSNRAQLARITCSASQPR
jgi:hypothetical protein